MASHRGIRTRTAIATLHGHDSVVGQTATGFCEFGHADVFRRVSFHENGAAVTETRSVAVTDCCYWTRIHGVVCKG